LKYFQQVVIAQLLIKTLKWWSDCKSVDNSKRLLFLSYILLKHYSNYKSTTKTIFDILFKTEKSLNHNRLLLLSYILLKHYSNYKSTTKAIFGILFKSEKLLKIMTII